MDERFVRSSRLIGEEDLHKLSEAAVMVVGLGGVGGYAAEALVRSGIGTLIVIDHDAIELSNFNRQILAVEDNLGERKTDAFARRALSINPEVRVICHDAFLKADNPGEFFTERVDYVVDAIDTLTSKVMLWKYCQENGIPVISSMGTARRLDPLKLQITTLDKTENDPMARALRQISRKNDVSLKVPVVCSREPARDTGAESLGSMMFVPAAAGILCASRVISDLIDNQDS